MTCPALVAESVVVVVVAPEVEIHKPRAVLRVLSVLLNVLEREEVSANVVENAVEDNADAVLVKNSTNFLKRIIISETAVDFVVVNCIVAVARALKNRIEHQRVYSELLEIVNPVVDFVKPVFKLKVVFSRRSCKA